MSPMATTRTNGFDVGIGLRPAIPLPGPSVTVRRPSCHRPTHDAWAGDMQAAGSARPARRLRAASTSSVAGRGWRNPCVFPLVGAVTHHPDDVRATSFYRDVIDALTASDVLFLVGGTYAMDTHACVSRETKDLDLFLRR